MARANTILVGTIGQSIMKSVDDGESWVRVGPRDGFHSDGIVRSLVSDSRRPEVVYAGTDVGLYRSDDGGAKWKLLDTPMNEATIWSMVIDPTEPDTMFVGTGTPSTPGVFKSTDGG